MMLFSRQNHFKSYDELFDMALRAALIAGGPTFVDTDLWSQDIAILEKARNQNDEQQLVALVLFMLNCQPHCFPHGSSITKEMLRYLNKHVQKNIKEMS